jgi:hypothetical protein
VYKIHVVTLQRSLIGPSRGLRSGLFAYNEAPAIAVAKDCWFRARFTKRALFSFALPLNSIT